MISFFLFFFNSNSFYSFQVAIDLGDYIYGKYMVYGGVYGTLMLSLQSKC